MYDCIVIGMGCAGMSAAIYAKNAGLKTLILEESAPGGLLNKIKNVNNYLGFSNISGSDLAFNMFEHVRSLGVEYKITKVLDIKEDGEYKVITTTKGEYKTHGIIVAVGRKAMRSGLSNEKDFMNKGISYCAVCDGALYKGKDVVVLGSDSTAFDEAVYLSNICNKVYFVSNKNVEYNFEEYSNIEHINAVKVKEFLGDEKISGILLENGSVINCSCVFIYYGYSSEVAFLNNLGIVNDKGYIDVDDNMKTNCDLVYACGDIINKELYQVSTAVSEGAIAAVSLNKELNGR